MNWDERYRIAATLLAVFTGVLLIADFYSMATEPDGSQLYLGLATIPLAVINASFSWRRVPRLIRLIPAVGVIAICVGAIVWGDLLSNRYADLGVGCFVVALMAYLGFSLPPGSALITSPLACMGIYALSQAPDLNTSIAPLLTAVPLGAILGEGLSWSNNRISYSNRQRQARLRSLEGFASVTKSFHRPINLSEAGSEIADAAKSLFGAAYSTVVLRQSNGELVTASVGDSGVNTTSFAGALRKLVVEAIGSSEPKIVVIKHSAMLICPISAGTDPAGVVVAYPIAQDDKVNLLATATLFSAQVSNAIEHLYVIDQLQKDSATDELTGIGNRKHANNLLESLKQGDALILLDLDGFKEVNDSLGHPAGDRVLLELSDHLRLCVRDSDTSARLGGDEFLVVAKRAFADPSAVAHRILTGWDTPGRSTTLSAGVAMHDPSVSSQMTYERADQALYKAKSQGKNQVVLWSDDKAAVA